MHKAIMTPQVFSSTEVSQISGVSRQRLAYWAQTKMLVPSVREAHGRGTRRLYSLDDLLQLNFIRRLQDHGWSTQKVRKAINSLHTFMAGSEPVVLIDAKDTILALYRNKTGEQVLLDTLRPGGQQVLEIVLETLVEETWSAAERYVEQVVNHE